MRLALVFWLGMAFSTPALATGGLDCIAEDSSVRFAVGASVTRGMGGPVYTFGGQLELLGKDVRDALRKTTFERQHLAQYWWDERELRLLIYRETEDGVPYGSVELTIRTQVSDESAFGGQYELTLYDMAGVTDGEGKTTVLTGAVSCFVE